MTQTSSDDNCEKSQESFVTFPTDNIYHKTTKYCESTAVKVTVDEFAEGARRKLDYTSKIRQKNFSQRCGKKTQLRQKTKTKTTTQKFCANVGSRVNATQERGNIFGNSRQELVPAIFKMVEKQSIDVQISVADELVIYDVCDQSTVEKLGISDVFVNG